VPGNPIDHITVTAGTLQRGADFVEQSLDVDMQAGGEHPRMGTHNRLLRLGGDMFLEVIAVNPSAQPPERPRWFDLDWVSRLAPPALSTWVIRTRDIRATHAAASEDLGNIEPMSRGELNWLITFPEDGSVALDGVAPALIEWQADVLPASRLEDKGLSLIKLEIFHAEPVRISRLLDSIGFDGPVVVNAIAPDTIPYLAAHIQTPAGLRVMPAVNAFVSNPARGKRLSNLQTVRKKIVIPKAAIKHWRAALQTEIERQLRIHREYHGDWPKDFDPDDMPLFESMLDELPTEPESVIAKYPFSKAFAFSVALISGYVQTHRAELSEPELAALLKICLEHAEREGEAHLSE
jgi:hypothetical protein